MYSEQYNKYKEAKEDLQKAVANFLEICSTMTPEMDVVREVTKLKGDFGRNKEAKWLSEYAKIEEEVTKKKKYAAEATPSTSLMQHSGLPGSLGPLGSVPMSPSEFGVRSGNPPSLASLASSSQLSSKDEMDMAMGRLQRLKMSGEINNEDLKKRLDMILNP